MSKQKKEFLIAVRGYKDWYEAITADKLVKIGNPESIQLKAPLDKALIFNAPDNYNLLYRAVSVSPGVEKDLQQTLAARIVADPTSLQQLIDIITEEEAQLLHRALTTDKSNELYLSLGEERYEAEVVSNLSYLQSLPTTSFEWRDNYDKKQYDYFTNLHSTYLAFQSILQDQTKSADDKQKDIESAVIRTLTGQTLIHTTNHFGIDFGDRYNPYTDDNLPPDEVKARFSVVKSLMAHWNEAGISSKNNKPYDAIANGKQVYIKKDFVQKKLDGCLPS